MSASRYGKKKNTPSGVRSGAGRGQVDMATPRFHTCNFGKVGAFVRADEDYYRTVVDRLALMDLGKEITDLIGEFKDALDAGILRHDQASLLRGVGKKMGVPA